MTFSMPKPPRSTGVNSTSWVSIQRTGEANCQASSSISRARPKATGWAIHASQLAKMASTWAEGTTSRMERAKSWVSSKGRATRLGTYRPTMRSMSMSPGTSASRRLRNSSTPGRSTLEWKGTSMPGTSMKGFLPPRALARARASAASASRPATVPATAYCTPARL